ncbi:MAG: hypothetical protein Kow0092_21200 [Deferrisomatales bacterium]
MDRKELMELFNRPDRLGTLTTGDGQGNLNAGVFSALQMVDEDTVVMACGENRSLANMRRHPKAVFLFFQPAAAPWDWKGARVYLDVVKIEPEGDLFDRLVATVRQMAGDQAAENIRAAVTFRIQDVRPIIDRG